MGGAEAFLARLAGALARRGLEQHALTRPEPRRLAALEAAGVPVTTAAFGGPLDLVTRARFRRAIRRFDPALVLTWLGRASAACPGGGFVHVGRLGGPYDLKRFSRCDHLIANTRALADWVKSQGWRADRVHVIGNFADEKPVVPVDRATLRTPADAHAIVALGRLHPHKAFDVLIEAVVRLPGAVLWLAGDGPIRGALEDQARRLGVADRVRFLGWREDAAALIAGADVLVCPSRQEPLGNVILEAWARGVPVIAAAADGPATLIAHDRNGVLVPVDDAEALRAALARVLGDAVFARTLGEEGRCAYRAEHGEALVTRRYLDLFARLAG
jgi:glycosyltransferase involved in cell wall biosynthesis